MAGNYNNQQKSGFYYQSRQVREGVVTFDTGYLKYQDITSFSDVAYSTLIKTPGWRKLKVKPINPYYTIRTVITNPINSFGRFVYYHWFDYLGHHYGYDSHQASADPLSYGADLSTPVHVNGAEDPIPYAERKLLKKLSTASSSSAVMLAELPKTVKAVAKTATKLAQALRALRRFDLNGMANALEITVTEKQRVRMGRKKREFILNHDGSDIIDNATTRWRENERRKLLRSLSKSELDRYNASASKTVNRTKDFFGDLWLEYSYGWKPLLSDVDDHAKALANYLTQHQNVVQHASASHQTESQVRLTEWLNPDRSRFRTSVVQKWGTVGVKYSNENVNAANVFGLLNPLQVAWELVPFSFVADWFIPIGQAIESLTATGGLTFHSGYTAYKTKVTNNCTVYSNPAYGSSDARYVNYGSGQCSLIEITFTRGRLSSFPSPSFPSFKDWRSLSHGASAIALLNSLFLSKK